MQSNLENEADYRTMRDKKQCLWE